VDVAKLWEQVGAARIDASAITGEAAAIFALGTSNRRLCTSQAAGAFPSEFLNKKEGEPS
jgi:hypothetical protein